MFWLIQFDGGVWKLFYQIEFCLASKLSRDRGDLPKQKKNRKEDRKFTRDFKDPNASQRNSLD